MSCAFDRGSRIGPFRRSVVHLDWHIDRAGAGTARRQRIILTAAAPFRAHSDFAASEFQPRQWTRQPRLIIMGGLWSVPMSDLLTGNRQYCLDKAADCERKAAQARHPDAAKEFQTIAARSRVAAAMRDFNNKVEDILRTLGVAA
jgi:hypothetical protein